MARRLPIAFLASAALALVCWLALPLIGFALDWRVPLVAFAIMAAAILLTGLERPAGEPDESPQAIDTDSPPEPRDSAADQR